MPKAKRAAKTKTAKVERDATKVKVEADVTPQDKNAQKDMDGCHGSDEVLDKAAVLALVEFIAVQPQRQIHEAQLGKRFYSSPQAKRIGLQKGYFKGKLSKLCAKK